MRLGVLDVGSNTVHLAVVDAHPGARPIPAADTRVELRLAELLDDRGGLSPKGAARLVRAVRGAVEAAEDLGVEELLAFATSAVRDASNSAAVLARVRAETGVDLQVLTGDDEARLTFLAVRRWYGWSAGRLLVLDIGGGSLEVAGGIDEDPDVFLSLPLGAGRLTREHLRGDPPGKSEVKALRKLVRAEVAKRCREVTLVGAPDRAVATSKTFRSLARIAGAAPSSEGPYARRTLTRDALSDVLDRVARLSAAERAGLPGVSVGRAPQLVAGALVAEAAMELLEVRAVEICPWALREGLILRRLDALGVAQGVAAGATTTTPMSAVGG